MTRGRFFAQPCPDTYNKHLFTASRQKGDMLMSFKKILFFGFAALSTLLALPSCTDKTDVGPLELTAEKIKQYLAGKSIPDPEGAQFQIDRSMFVDLLESKTSGVESNARIFLIAVDTAAKTGLQGELELSFEFDGRTWLLHGIKAKSIEKLEEPYARRLADLVDFPLHFSANIGDGEQVQRELAKGTPVDSPEAKKLSTALMFAAERGFLDIVKRLQAAGADINHNNKFGFTALHAAANANRSEVVKYLLDNGAKVDSRDHLGQTPLYYAAEKNSLEIARMLIEKGADVNATTEKSWTPLYVATANNCLDVAKVLLENGAHVNIKVRDGNHSPLLVAAYNNNLEMVQLLLAAGADVTAKLSKDHSGFRGLDSMELARRQGNKAIVELLKNQGAK